MLTKLPVPYYDLWVDKDLVGAFSVIVKNSVKVRLRLQSVAAASPRTRDQVKPAAPGADTLLVTTEHPAPHATCHAFVEMYYLFLPNHLQQK